MLLHWWIVLLSSFNRLWERTAYLRFKVSDLKFRLWPGHSNTFALFLNPFRGWLGCLQSVLHHKSNMNWFLDILLQKFLVESKLTTEIKAILLFFFGRDVHLRALSWQIFLLGFYLIKFYKKLNWGMRGLHNFRCSCRYYLVFFLYDRFCHNQQLWLIKIFH